MLRLAAMTIVIVLLLVVGSSAVEWEHVMTETKGGGKRKSFGINGLSPILVP